MAIALVASVSAALGPAGGTTGAFTTTGATCIIVTVASDAGGTPAVSDSKGNTYIGLTQRTAGGPTQRLFYVINPVVGTSHTITVSGAATYAAVVVYAYAGVTGYDGQQNGATGGTSPLACGSVTPSVNGALIFTGLSGDTPVTDAAPSGFTGLITIPGVGGTNYQISAAYLIQTTAAPINPSWSWTGGGHGAAAAVAVFIEGMAASVRTTQDAIELLSLPVPTARISQTVIEALSATALVPGRVTQYVVEALSTSVAPPPLKDYTWQIEDLTDVDRWMTGLLVFPMGETPAPVGVPAGRVLIPMHVTTRVIFAVGMNEWGADCLCDE
jgi:hypothetical protein